jgi:hypothetical protein
MPRRRLPFRIARASLRTLVLALIFIVGGVLALLRTALGHEVVLNWLVAQADQRGAGTVQVDGIRSGGLLSGARLYGVSLRTPAGLPFVTADSLDVSYRIRGLLSGTVALDDVKVWGLGVDFTWERGTEGSTLARWLGPGRGGDASAREGGEPPETEGATEEDAAGAEGEGDASDDARFALTDVELVDARLRIRTPSDLDPGGVVRVTPSGGGTLALDLNLDTASIPSVRVRSESRGGTRVVVDALSGELDLLREVIAIEALEAEATITGGRVDAEVGTLRIPQGLAAGEVTVFTAPESRRRVELELALEELDREQLDWLLPWFPRVERMRADLVGTVDRGVSRWSFSDLRAGWGGAPVTGSGRLVFSRGVSLDDVAVQADGVPVSELAQWLPAAADKPGELRGNLVLNGPVEALGVVGRVSVAEGGVVSVADLNGSLVAGEGELGFQDFRAFASPLHFSTVSDWVPALPVGGTGTARVVLNGAPRGGLRLEAEVTHTDEARQLSRVVAQGSIRVPEEGWQVDVQGDAAPFQLAALTDQRPDLPVSGAVVGSFRVRGDADSLAVRAVARDSLGTLELDGSFRPSDLSATAAATAVAQAFPLGRYLPALGGTTRISGRAGGVASGRGPALQGSAYLRLQDSDLRGLFVDSVLVEARAATGRLLVDTVRATVAGIELDGAGSLGLRRGETEEGTFVVEARADSLAAIRPLFMPGQVTVRDTLSVLDQEVLILSGVNPDTLPLEAEVRVNGRASGRMEVAGWTDDFRGVLALDLEGFRFDDYFVQEAHLRAEGSGLPSASRLLELEFTTDSIGALDREFERTRINASLTGNRVRALVDLTRSAREGYVAAGGVEMDSTGYRIALDQLDLRFDDAEFALAAPTRILWTDSALAVDQLEVIQPGDRPVRILADGVLPQRGAADFRVQLRGLPLGRVTQLLQVEDVSLGGRVDLDVRVEGAASEPVIQAYLFADSLSVGEFTADSARSTLDYAGLEAAVEIDAFRAGARFLEGGGTVPVNLSLQRGTRRLLDRAMDLRATLDRVEVAPLLALLEDLEDVQGTLSGDFTVTGTLDDPVPEGLLRLEDAAWTVGALGVRQEDVTGTFTLTRDGSVAVNARAVAGGPVDASGEVKLTPITDPELNVDLRFQGFQGVARRDVEGSLSGLVTLSGRYRQPVVSGNLTVDQGVIYLEEFQRAVGVVDLTDPLFQGLVDQGNFILPADRPILSGIRNPFLDNLRVEVNLDVPRDTWLRSTELNVEIGGNLAVTYDRIKRDLVLVGDLQARRGQYNLYGRNFQVRGGTVSFIGVPGINPLLNIQATSPVRRPDQSRPLEIQASVQGTLVEPRVELSTEEAGYAQSDLVSYLILGRPSSEIVGAESATGAALAAGGSYVLGDVASQLSALAVQSFGINYLAVSQIGALGLSGGQTRDSFRSTQVEVGRYFSGGDIFGVLVVQPLNSGVNPVSGVRVEWQANAQYQLEAFVEDRFLRQGGFGLDELTRTRLYAWGLGVFREWGY